MMLNLSSLRWHDPDRFDGYDLSLRDAGTPEDDTVLGKAVAHKHASRE